MAKNIFAVFVIALYLVFNVNPVFGSEIHNAAADGDLETLKSIVDNNPIAVNERDLRKGKDTRPDKNGWTPLHFAVANDHCEIVVFLLSKNADPGIGNEMGATALFFARTKEMALLLIKKGADINKRDNCGNTALHLAANGGHQGAVAAFISSGAEVNALNNLDYSPLIFACGMLTSNHYEVVRLLLKNHANPHIKSKDGFTAKINAQKWHNLKVLNILKNY